MSSKPGTSIQNTQTSNAPLGGAQGTLFNNIWGDTANTLGTNLSTPIPQNNNALATAPQWQGANEMLNVAPWLGSTAGSTLGLSNKIGSGFFSNPQNNPNFQGAVKAAIDPLTTSWNTNILPSINDASIRSSGAGGGPSAYGSSTGQGPQDTKQLEGAQSFANTVGNTTAGMANNAYNAGLGLMSLIPGLNSSGIASALAPSLATEQAGGLMQGFNQIPLTNMFQNWQLNTGAPQQFEQAAASTGATGGFGAQNKSQQTTGPAPNMMTQILQGLTGGGSMFNSLFGGSGGGGGLGSLLGSLGSAGGGTSASYGVGMPSWMSMLANFMPAAAAA